MDRAHEHPMKKFFIIDEDKTSSDTTPSDTYKQSDQPGCSESDE